MFSLGVTKEPRLLELCRDFLQAQICVFVLFLFVLRCFLWEGGVLQELLEDHLNP